MSGLAASGKAIQFPSPPVGNKKLKPFCMQFRKDEAKQIRISNDQSPKPLAFRDWGLWISSLFRFVLPKSHAKWLQFLLPSGRLGNCIALPEAARPLNDNHLQRAGTSARRAPEGQVSRNDPRWPKEVCCPSRAGFSHHPLTPCAQYFVFRFRISDLFRISIFGFRISWRLHFGPGCARLGFRACFQT